VRAISRAHRLTPNTLVQGAWALVLRQLGGADDVVFGATSAGRPPALAGVETMIGLFITTVPVRVGVDPARPVASWLRAIQEQQTAAREHEHAGEQAIQGWMGLDDATSPFSSVLRFQNYPVDVALRAPLGPLRVTDVGITDIWPHPLCLIVHPGDPMRVGLTYDRGVIDDARAEQALATFAHALAGIAAGIDGQVADVVAQSARA
jgi:nonribosomal peptide synthetase CepB